MSFEYFIARRYLKAKRKQAFISLITVLSIAGVGVGVMALVIVIAVMSGAESDFRSRILGFESHILVMRHGAMFSEYKNISKSIKNINGVKEVAPFIYTQVMLRSSRGASGVMLRGIEPDTSVQIIKGFDAKKLKKSLSSENSVMPGIILGKELALNLGVVKGDILYLISPRGMVSPIGHVPSMKRFKVKGLFSSNMYEYDSSLAYIHIKEAQKILKMKNSVSSLGIWINDIYSADKIAKNITKKLGYPYWAKDWMQMNQNLFSALKLEKTAMFIILTLIVLVAAFNISSTLIMMVMEKTKDIAILKAMGATDASIRKIFVFQGMVIGIIGNVFGIVSGLGVCILLKRYKFIKLPPPYPFQTLPIKIESFDVCLIALSAVIICFLATLYPAYQASKLNPVEAIRYG